MEPPVIAAIVTSIASCIASIVSLFSAKNAVKSAGLINGKLQKELELLKFDLDKKRSEEKFKFQLTEKQITALDKVISGIQDMKDVLNLAINCDENSYSSKAFETHIAAAAQKVIESYKEESTNLDDPIMRVAHDLKHAVMSLEYSGDKYTKSGKFVSLDDEQKERFISLRDKLSDKQQILRDARYRLISKTI